MIESEYRSATERAAWFLPTRRVLFRIEGRSPALLLKGILSGTLPGPLHEPLPGIREGRAFPSAVLTPKGKMVAELRLHRLENGEDGAFLCDLPLAARSGWLEHLSRYLNPRFARFKEITEELEIRTLVGPEGPRQLAALFPGAGLEEGDWEKGESGMERIFLDPVRGDLRVVRNSAILPLAFDLIGTPEAFQGLPLADGGSLPQIGEDTWEILRVERGTPVFGQELDPEVMPPEAGLETHWLDEQKGCYTGQEVMVRIRDRGRVNRLLRGILLGQGQGAAPGVPVWSPERSSPVGVLRTVVQSPRFGQVIALAYLRREVEPMSEVYISELGGSRGSVRALSGAGWVEDLGSSEV